MTPIERQLENCRLLATAVQQEPDDKINLDAYQSYCGTLHCILGLATTLPAFRDQGLGFRVDGGVSYGGRVTVRGASSTIWDIDEMFGLDTCELFAMYGYGYEYMVDDRPQFPDFPAYGNRAGVRLAADGRLLTHKELALLRLDYHIAKLEAAAV